MDCFVSCVIELDFRDCLGSCKLELDFRDFF